MYITILCSGPNYFFLNGDIKEALAGSGFDSLQDWCFHMLDPDHDCDLVGNCIKEINQCNFSSCFCSQLLAFTFLQ